MLWARSFHRSPFHAYAQWSGDLAGFLAALWITRPRDEIPEMVLASPALLWQRKVESYVAQAARRANVLLLRHERLLADHAAVLAQISRFLPVRGCDWVVPDGHGRDWDRSGRDFATIRAELPAEPWRVLTDEERAALLRHLDPALVDRLGYAPT